MSAFFFGFDVAFRCQSILKRREHKSSVVRLVPHAPDQSDLPDPAHKTGSTALNGSPYRSPQRSPARHEHLGAAWHERSRVLA